MIHTLVRAAVRFIPDHYGLWSMARMVPWRPDPDALTTTQLRGYPLRMRFKPGSYVGVHLFYRGMYEPHNVQMCSRLLRKGMTFIDIGANYGLYTLVAAHSIGNTGVVLSVEPQADLAQLVADNAAMNGLHNVVVQPYALSNASGPALLYQPSRSNGSSTLRVQDGETCIAEALPVTCKTLPEVVADSAIALKKGVAIKIDVEGAELSILEQASDLLRSGHVEFLMCESVDSHLRRFGATSEDLLAFLWNHGFRTACLCRGQWREINTYQEYVRHGHVPDVFAVRPGTPSWNRVVGTIFANRA